MITSELCGHYFSCNFMWKSLTTWQKKEKSERSIQTSEVSIWNIIEHFRPVACPVHRLRKWCTAHQKNWWTWIRTKLSPTISRSSILCQRNEKLWTKKINATENFISTVLNREVSRMNVLFSCQVLKSLWCINNFLPCVFLLVYKNIIF